MENQALYTLVEGFFLCYNKLMPKHAGGRPVSITKEVETKLEDAFRSDFTNEEACRSVDISEKTFYRKCKANESFDRKMRAAKDYAAIKAKKNVINGIHEGDKNDSKWYLERRRKKDWSTRTEFTGEDGGPVSIITKVPVIKEE